jgi:tetratricopeptide (TPR) repeat protein
MLAKLLVRSNRFDDGIAIFQRLANAEPKDADMWIRLGSTYRLKNDLNGALECFKRASELAPNDQGTLLQIGLLMEETGKRDQARPIYERILKINPNHAVALNNLAYIRAEEGGDLDQALSMAQRALQNLPSAHEISDTVGLIYIKKALSQEAVRVLDDLVKLEPSNPTFRFHLAMALQQKGDKPRARKEAEEALRNKPSTDVEKQIRSLLTAI